MPKFSVIIPLYNKESYISDTIASVLNQSFNDFELLIINDCSTDNSLTKVLKFDDFKIKIINHKNNKGLSASRNTGIENAAGDFITFLDADDFWKPYFLESTLILIDQFPDCDVFGTDYEEKINGKILYPKKNLPSVLKTGTTSKILDFFNAALYNPIYCYSSVTFSRKVFDTIGFFDTSIDYGEDVDFNIRVNTVFSLAYYYKPCATYNLGIDSQITESGLKEKRLLDFTKFDVLARDNNSLKNYLNTKRYYYASQYKNQGDNKNFQKFMSEIDFNRLSWKQKVLLKSPILLYRIFKNLKMFLLKKGIKITPY